MLVQFERHLDYFVVLDAVAVGVVEFVVAVVETGSSA